MGQIETKIDPGMGIDRIIGIDEGTGNWNRRGAVPDCEQTSVDLIVLMQRFHFQGKFGGIIRPPRQGRVHQHPVIKIEIPERPVVLIRTGKAIVERFVLGNRTHAVPLGPVRIVRTETLFDGIIGFATRFFGGQIDQPAGLDPPIQN